MPVSAGWAAAAVGWAVALALWLLLPPDDSSAHSDPTARQTLETLATATALARCKVDHHAALAHAATCTPCPWTHTRPDDDVDGTARTDQQLALPPWLTPDLLHAKLFGGAQPPVNVLPLWIHAPEDHPARRDATFVVTTHLTPDRLTALTRLCAHWAGPVSAALHWDADRDGIPDAGALRAAVAAAVPAHAAAAGCALDVHLVVDEHRFIQLNLWRNVARFYAASPYHLMVDVDFVPDRGLRAALEEDRDRWVSWLNQGRVLVVPAFEPAATEDVEYPATKNELEAQLVSGAMRMFHPDWFHGQGHTDYDRWRAATAPYRPLTYHFKWEPYVIAGPSAPWCDEGFVGYGSNKCACIVEMWMAGIEFWVLPSHFLVHQPHPSDRDPAATREARDRRRARENEANVHTLRRFLEVLEVRYRRRAPIVASNPGATVSMLDGTELAGGGPTAMHV